MKRHIARETALKMIFQLDVGKNQPAQALLTLQEAGLDDAAEQFASMLSFSAFEKRDELDKILSKYLAQDWSVERLSNVDKNILRLALYEIYYCEDIPIPVSIDEAIELAKTYGSAEAPAFINGVLDKLVKSEKLQKNPVKAISEQEDK